MTRLGAFHDPSSSIQVPRRLSPSSPHRYNAMMSLVGSRRSTPENSHAHLWRHLRSLSHAFERSLDDSLKLTELDKDRIATLAEFFKRSGNIEALPLEESLRPESLGRSSSELTFAPHISLVSTLENIPEFVDWKRSWKVPEGEIIRKLTSDLESLLVHADDAERSRQLPAREARIIRTVLQTMISHTEPTIAR
jgi:hypothetical protein